MGKLVRDRIPDIIRSGGQEPTVLVLDHEGYGDALFDKLVEEAEELRGADPDYRLEELADVYEVLLAAIDLLDVTLEQLVETASMKQATRGGFERRLWLEDGEHKRA